MFFWVSECSCNSANATATGTREYCKGSFAAMQSVTQWTRRNFMYDAANQMNMTADDVVESFAPQSSAKQVTQATAQLSNSTLSALCSNNPLLPTIYQTKKKKKKN